LKEKAPQVGLEPTTLRLTVALEECGQVVASLRRSNFSRLVVHETQSTSPPVNLPAVVVHSYSSRFFVSVGADAKQLLLPSIDLSNQQTSYLTIDTSNWQTAVGNAQQWQQVQHYNCDYWQWNWSALWKWQEARKSVNTSLPRQRMELTGEDVSLDGRPVPSEHRFFVGARLSPNEKLLVVMRADGRRDLGSLMPFLGAGPSVHGRHYLQIMRADNFRPLASWIPLNDLAREEDVLSPCFIADDQFLLLQDNNKPIAVKVIDLRPLTAAKE
jgi:hypothetical protein